MADARTDSGHLIVPTSSARITRFLAATAAGNVPVTTRESDDRAASESTSVTPAAAVLVEMLFQRRTS